jgi:hypothetical protein
MVPARVAGFLLPIQPGMTNRIDHIRGWGLWAAVLCLVIGVAAAGCGSASEDASLRNETLSEREEAMLEARTALATHRIDDGRAKYDEIVGEYPDFGRAVAGRAVTRALLLPGSEPVSTIVRDVLGGDAGLDAVSAIYADKGYLYWLSRGATWEGGGQFAGIKNLLSNRLPWSEDRLDSLSAFTAELTRSVGESRVALLSLTEELAAIESDIDRALADDDFTSYTIPAAVFHDSDLTVVMGRSEFALLGGISAGLRALIHAALAYEHDWTLERAFGPHWTDDVEDASGERVHWKEWDFSLDYLDRNLLRSLSPQAGGRGLDAKAALADALGYMVLMFETGLADGSDKGSLNWDRVDRAYAEDWKSVASAVRLALDTQTRIPSTDPSVTANFSDWFLGPRVLESDVDWLTWEETEIEVGGDGGDAITEIDIRWSLNDRAIQSVFVDGFFEPPFSLPMETEPEFALDGESFETFRTNLWGELRGRFEEAYLIRE